jgi:hypothetical protein
MLLQVRLLATALSLPISSNILRYSLAAILLSNMYQDLGARYQEYHEEYSTLSSKKKAFEVTSSTLVETLYHLSLCLNTFTEAFLLRVEPYPFILSPNLDLSLSTWYCAIIRLPTIFSSSGSLSSSMSGA